MKSTVLNINRRLQMPNGGFMPRTRIRNRQSAIRNPPSGFTLIELLLVLVILATLAAIVTPKFAKRSEQAKITAARTQLAYFETALDAFEIDVGRYPTNAEGLCALVERPTSNADGWQQAYLKSTIPQDPWGGEYIYRYPGQYNQDGYDLYSYGPDRKLGGDDDITNWSKEQAR
ncbi:MAG: type II secretion system major pseudopilin GspG [Sedimentisphaerales bacterium]|nr:type II secretion system major pseudopilin GspG [Sedimentisphaerales bacterium]